MFSFTGVEQNKSKTKPMKKNHTQSKRNPKQIKKNNKKRKSTGKET